MTAPPQTFPDHGAQLSVALAAVGATARRPVGVAQSTNADAGAAPPHLLWETLESAFSGPEIDAPLLYGAPVAQDKRMAGYVAMPLVLGSSLALWVVIVMVVLSR